jgi:hypothetical protein
LPRLFPISQNLQQLTNRTAVYIDYAGDLSGKRYLSYHPAAAEVINLFMSSLQHLVLDIDLHLLTFVDLTRVNFSPLAVLGAASLLIRRIDLYVRTGIFPPAVTRALLLSSLEDCKDIVRSIKEGILVIHSEKTALGSMKPIFSSGI